MSGIIEWDVAKAARNFRKHGIRFEEAALVFDDTLAASALERIENGEERWQTVGLVGGCLLLLVAHTVHVDEVEIIRIVSARRADPTERKNYEHG
jgi:uncharacterized DUF497 family protein